MSRFYSRIYLSHPCICHEAWTNVFQAGLLTLPPFQRPSHLPKQTVTHKAERVFTFQKRAGSQRRARPGFSPGSLFIRAGGTWKHGKDNPKSRGWQVHLAPFHSRQMQGKSIRQGPHVMLNSGRSTVTVVCSPDTLSTLRYP